jgi:hypothetical protein
MFEIFILNKFLKFHKILLSLKMLEFNLKEFLFSAEIQECLDT